MNYLPCFWVTTWNAHLGSNSRASQKFRKILVNATSQHVYHMNKAFLAIKGGSWCTDMCIHLVGLGFMAY